MTFLTRMKAAAKAASLHLLISSAVAALSALLVFTLWFPLPYRKLAGGMQLFWLIVAVDLVTGPLLTLVIFNPLKRRSELVRDIGLIAVIQAFAFGYGLHALSMARPVWLAFEVDLFRIVTRADIDPTLLPEAQSGLARLGYAGPRTIAAHVPKPGDADHLQSVQLAMAGVPPAIQPKYWRGYETQRAQVKKAAKPVNQLRARGAAYAATLDAALVKYGLNESSTGYLPLHSRDDTSWIVLVDRADANVVGYAPLDAY